jgi:hypothetical protein
MIYIHRLKTLAGTAHYPSSLMPCTAMPCAGGGDLIPRHARPRPPPDVPRLSCGKSAMVVVLFDHCAHGFTTYLGTDPTDSTDWLCAASMLCS